MIFADSASDEFYQVCTFHFSNLLSNIKFTRIQLLAHRALSIRILFSSLSLPKSNMFVAKVSVSINGTVSDRPLPLVASYVRRGRYLRYTHSCRSVPGKILSCAKIWISSQYSLAVKHRHILNEMKNQEIKTQLTHTVLNKELVILPTFDSFSGESALSNIQRPSDCGLVSFTNYFLLGIMFNSGICWMFIFYQTFVLLAFHYVYRFVLICESANL